MDADHVRDQVDRLDGTDCLRLDLREATVVAVADRWKSVAAPAATPTTATGAAKTGATEMRTIAIVVRCVATTGIEAAWCLRNTIERITVSNAPFQFNWRVTSLHTRVAEAVIRDSTLRAGGGERGKTQIQECFSEKASFGGAERQGELPGARQRLVVVCLLGRECGVTRRIMAWRRGGPVRTTQFDETHSSEISSAFGKFGKQVGVVQTQGAERGRQDPVKVAEGPRLFIDVQRAQRRACAQRPHARFGCGREGDTRMRHVTATIRHHLIANVWVPRRVRREVWQLAPNASQLGHPPPQHSQPSKPVGDEAAHARLILRVCRRKRRYVCVTVEKSPAVYRRHTALDVLAQ